MGMKKTTAPAKPKRADVLGRFKSQRHGTRHWTSWMTESRIAPAVTFHHAGRRPARSAA